MRILFAMRHLGSLRMFESVISQLAERGHTVHIAVDRGEKLGSERTAMLLNEKYPNVTFGWAVTGKGGKWFHLSHGVRLLLDYLRFLQHDYRMAPKLRLRAEEHLPPLVPKLAQSIPFLKSRFGLWVLRGVLGCLERSLPRVREIEEFLKQQRPDLILITPLIYLGSSQCDLLRSAKILGYRTALCVGSWDHLSSKALIRDLPDLVLVWNMTQKEEAVNFHRVPEDRICVSGAQCYDQWFGRSTTRSKEDFCGRVGLDPRYPFFLYVCSALFRGSPLEAKFVKDWVAKMRSSPDPLLKKAGILIRPHPSRLDEWQDISLSQYENVTLWGSNPVDSESKADYFDSMSYSEAVIGLNTSAFIEAGIVGRPVYAILDPSFQENQEGTLHFHYLLNIQGGLLRTSSSIDENISQLKDLLSGNDPDPQKSRRFVEAFVRPHGFDKPASPLFVEALERLGREKEPPSQKAPFWTALLRPILFMVLVITKAYRRKRAPAAKVKPPKIRTREEPEKIERRPGNKKKFFISWKK